MNLTCLVQLPKVRILYPTDYLPTVNNAQTQLINNFVEGLERTLNVKRTEISLAETWSSDCPDGLAKQDLKEYLELVSSPFLRLTGFTLTLIFFVQARSYPYYRDAYYALQPFVKEYQDKVGKAPFIHRTMLWQW